MEEKKNIMINALIGPVDNLKLLEILPFGTGYYLLKDGKPCENSLAVAMMLQHVDATINPYVVPRTWTN